MVTSVVLLDVQFRTVGVPGRTALGWALKVIVGLGPEVVTFTTVEVALVPPGPAAVAVYVVVAVGVAFTEPVAGKLPRPLMVTEVALLAFQVRVVDVPLSTVLGCAAIVIAGRAEFCCPDMDPPPQPIAAIKIESKIDNAKMGRKDRIETPC
jgi:hypothetical protein